MADSLTAAEVAEASERAGAAEPMAVSSSSSAEPQAPQLSQPHPAPQPPQPPPVFAVTAPPITRSQMAINEPPKRMRELRPRLQVVAHAAAAAAAATVTQLAHPPQRASASSIRAAAAATSDSSSLSSTSPDSLHMAQSPPSTAVAAAAFTPPGADAYDEPAADPRRALFFVAPDAGLVQNKPFSFELRATLHHASTSPCAASASGAALSPPVASLLFQLALKVSAKPMEKRSNVYEPIDAVWIKAKEVGESISKQTDADDTDEDESGAEASEGEPTAASRSHRRPQRNRPSSSAASASSSEASSAALALSTLTTVPIRTVVLTKSAREKIRDRSIGLEDILTSRPAESAMATAAARSLHALLSRLHVTMTAVAQHKRGGLLEIVTTKGGAIAARPQQRSDWERMRMRRVKQPARSQLSHGAFVFVLLHFSDTF